MSDLEPLIESTALVDHHVHAPWPGPVTERQWRDGFNEADTESGRPGLDPLDSQVGFAVRAWCAPLLDLPRHAPAIDYWRRREELGDSEVTARFVNAAGVSDWLVDTGFGGLMPESTRGRTHEVVRLESLVEQAGEPDEFGHLLAERCVDAVAVKTVMAYRCGFDVDLSRPSAREVGRAWDRWRLGEDPTRVSDPVLIAFAIHEALAMGMPLQIHVGMGDRDLDLRRCDPLLLTEFLCDQASHDSAVLLLHCYPFERQAGYLAQAFANVYLDVGLAINYLGARSGALIARSMELAPLTKLLYSSDAYGPAELHYLGARLWRSGMAAALTRWVEADEWSAQDAARVVEMSAWGNARRAYPRLS